MPYNDVLGHSGAASPPGWTVQGQPPVQHLNNETNPENKGLLRLYRDTVEFSTVYTGSDEETLVLEGAIISVGSRYEPERH